MEKKQYKIFNYIFWLSIILDFFFLILSIYNQATYLLYYKEINYIKQLIFIFLIINAIILYKQFKTIYNSNLGIEHNQKIITKFFSFFFIIIVIIITSKQITFRIENDRLYKFKETANIALKTYKTFQKNKIYNINEIQSNVSIHKSPFNRNYKKDSFIATLGENDYICLNDGLYLIEGTKDNYNIIKNSKCNYDYIYDNIEIYITTILKEKYNEEFLVHDCIDRKDYDSEFNNVNGMVCRFNLDNSNDIYNVYISKKDLKITDNFLIK